MEWQAFLDLADSILASRKDAAAVRTVIGRAYCGSYNSAHAYQRSLHVKPRSVVESDHSSVPKGYLGCSDPTAKDIARGLELLRSLRHRADYDLSAPDVELEETAHVALKLAWAIMSSLDHCRTNLDQDTLRQEMHRMI